MKLDDVLIKVRNDPDARKEAFDKAVAAGIYQNTREGALEFLTDLVQPYSVPAGAPANTPPQPSPKQYRLAELAQKRVESANSANQGFAIAAGAGAMAVTGLVGYALVNSVKGTEDHVKTRQAIREAQGEKFQGSTHGRKPYYEQAKTQTAQKASDQREDGKDVVAYASAGLSLAVVGALIYALIKRS